MTRNGSLEFRLLGPLEARARQPAARPRGSAPTGTPRPPAAPGQRGRNPRPPDRGALARSCAGDGLQRARRSRDAATPRAPSRSSRDESRCGYSIESSRTASTSDASSRLHRGRTVRLAPGVRPSASDSSARPFHSGADRRSQTSPTSLSPNRRSCGSRSYASERPREQDRRGPRSRPPRRSRRRAPVPRDRAPAP